MAIKAVVFDIGGVLEITPRTGWEQRWVERLQVDKDQLNERLMGVWKDGSLGTIDEDEVERSIGEILGLDAGEVELFIAELWDEYLGAPNTELIEYFANLRPRYVTAMLSNSFAGARRHEHARYGFGDLCDLIVYSHEEGVAKPERRIYEVTWERLGLRPEEIVFLDDHQEPVDGALAVGMHAVLFRSNEQAIAEIETLLAHDDQAQHAQPWQRGVEEA